MHCKKKTKKKIITVNRRKYKKKSRIQKKKQKRKRKIKSRRLQKAGAVAVAEEVIEIVRVGFLNQHNHIWKSFTEQLNFMNDFDAKIKFLNDLFIELFYKKGELITDNIQTLNKFYSKLLFEYCRVYNIPDYENVNRDLISQCLQALLNIGLRKKELQRLIDNLDSNLFFIVIKKLFDVAKRIIFKAAATENPQYDAYFYSGMGGKKMVELLSHADFYQKNSTKFIPIALDMFWSMGKNSFLDEFHSLVDLVIFAQNLLLSISMQGISFDISSIIDNIYHCFDFFIKKIYKDKYHTNAEKIGTALNSQIAFNPKKIYEPENQVPASSSSAGDYESCNILLKVLKSLHIHDSQGKEISLEMYRIREEHELGTLCQPELLYALLSMAYAKSLAEEAKNIFYLFNWSSERGDFSDWIKKTIFWKFEKPTLEQMDVFDKVYFVYFGEEIEAVERGFNDINSYGKVLDLGKLIHQLNFTDEDYIHLLNDAIKHNLIPVHERQFTESLKDNDRRNAALLF